MSELVYHKASNLPEAVALNAANPDLPVIAGGTDLIVQWRSGLIAPRGFVDISSVSELKKINSDEKYIEIGACATHAMICSDADVRAQLPSLAEACASIGASQIQNRGTIGGNIMNASPAGDTLPVILVYDAQLKLQSVKGERWVPASEFFTGYRKTIKDRDELLTAVRFEKRMTKRHRSAFYKIGTRRAQAISKVVMCLLAEVDHGALIDISIAVGSVAPTVVRAFGTESLLKGKVVNAPLIEHARHSIMDEFHPIDDVRSSEGYRRFICGSLLERFLLSAIRRRK